MISGSSALQQHIPAPRRSQAQLCWSRVEFADERTSRLKVSLLFPTFQLSNGDITAFYKPLKHQDISAAEVRQGLGHSSASVDLHNGAWCVMAG